MRRSGTLVAVLLAAAICLAGTPATARADERILAYHADIVVAKDATITVTETIKVRAEGKKIKRGIFRDLPTDYYHPKWWGKVWIDYDVARVLRDGKAERWHVDTSHIGYKRIYIGDKGTLLKKGVYTYTLTYRPTRTVLGFFEKHDELYWNVTGNEWDFPIDKASATVTLPGGIPIQDIAHEAYTGPKGDDGKDYKSEIDGRGKVQFRVTRPLKIGEGLTIVATFPKGFVTPPTGAEAMANFLADNGMVLVGLLGVILMSSYYAFAWFRVGRDPEKGVIFPHFEPPGGMCPASLRYLLRMGYDKTCLAAEVLSLAVKRRLRIEDDDGEYSLQKESHAASNPLSRAETEVWNQLFSGGNSVKLLRRSHARLAKVIKGIKAELADEYKGKLFLTNIGWFIPGAILTALAIAGMGLADLAVSGNPVALFLCLFLAFWTFACVALVRGVVSAWAQVRSSRGLGKIGSAGGAMVITLFAFPFLIAEAVLVGMLAYTTSLWTLPILIVLIAANGWFFQLLKQPTIEGREVMDQIEGFRMYLATAEGELLESATPPERTPELFEKFLPYALALGVDNQWAEKFDDVLSRAASAVEGGYRPGWYHGGAWTAVGATAFAGSLGSSLSSALSSASTAPGSSSGSGGGGSSGGGGGGGGGGGW